LEAISSRLTTADMSGSLCDRHRDAFSATARGFSQPGTDEQKVGTHQPGAEEFNWDPQVLVFFF